MKILSILLPTYNYYLGVKRNIDIILSLSLEHLDCCEVIISDDSSDPMVRDLIRQESTRSPIIKYYLGPQQGAIKNWNSLITKTTASHFILLHADEFFYDASSLTSLLEYIKSNSADVYILKLIKIKGEKRFPHAPNPIYHIPIVFPQILYYFNTYGSPSVIVVKSTLFGINFDERLKWLVDVDWYIRLFKSSQKIYFLREVLICSDLNFTGNLTNVHNLKKLVYDEFRILSGSSVKKYFFMRSLHYLLIPLKLFIVWPRVFSYIK